MYAYLIAAVVAVVMLAGSYLQGRKDGGNIARADYAARDLKAATDYAAKEREITEAYRAKEAKLAQQVASVSKDYQGRLKKNEAALDIALASGRLYDRFAAPRPACGDSAATPAATPSGRDGGAGAYLSEASGSFLRGLASEADSVVIQLTACQQVLASDRSP